MAFNITKISNSMKALADWTKAGFGVHNTRISALENNTRVGSFAANQAEFDQTVNAAPTQETIFNSWYRFSHNALGVYPANASELTAWNYDSATGRINNTTNSATFIGMASKAKYENYVFDVDVWSTANDDDLIGILLAWYKDPATNKEYTLSAVRSPGGWQPHYGICYNHTQGAANGQKDVVNGNAMVITGNGDGTALHWGQLAAKWGTNGHTRIRAERRGDIIEVMTSNWNDPATLMPDSLLRADLSTDPLLAKFRGPSEYGLVSLSQPSSFWQVNEFSNPKDAIYRLDTGKAYSNVGGTWVENPDLSVANLGTNVFLLNPYTGKTYFMMDPTKIFDMYSKLL